VSDEGKDLSPYVDKVMEYTEGLGLDVEEGALVFAICLRSCAENVEAAQLMLQFVEEHLVEEDEKEEGKTIH